MRLEDYIREGKEGSYNLKDLYKKLNKAHFGGSLPNIKVSWSSKLRRAIGKASVQFASPIAKSQIRGYLPFASSLPEIPVSENLEINLKTLKIVVSSAFDLAVADIKAVMLHEMVHIYLYTKKKIGQHHDTPEFDGWIQKLRSETGLEVPYKESSFKKSPKIKGKDGFVIIVHESSGRKGIATYTVSFMKKNWLIFAETMTRIMNYGSKVNMIEYFRVNDPVIVVYPAKRSLRQISWTIVDDETIERIQKKGKKWGFSDHQGGSISPHTVGMKDKDMHPIPVLLGKDGKATNLAEVIKKYSEVNR